MDLVQVITIAIVASILIILVREKSPSIAFMLVLFTGILIFFVVAREISQLFGLFQQMMTRMNMSMIHLDTILKVIGVAYLTEFTSQLLKDAQLQAIAVKVELAGKIFILVIALPIFIAVLETLMKFLPS
ncbi:stage III sporulation protein AD [Halalkalibacillus sediminis]|uniref:Stage III sporulation protein AD n=1 Tax=Halalkalibacillus sediminis TaxID=2018042 RepID=A0A2I0QXB9_9BACI|nr:stage III sporulation protein AD [Halalkalibacillus sediminis]PKR78964.1 stage III sporulation protein AD [Halalkalibacillus sediminis]